MDRQSRLLGRVDYDCPVWTSLHNNQKAGTIRSMTGCAMRTVSDHSDKRNGDNWNIMASTQSHNEDHEGSRNIDHQNLHSHRDRVSATITAVTTTVIIIVFTLSSLSSLLFSFLLLFSSRRPCASTLYLVFTRQCCYLLIVV